MANIFLRTAPLYAFCMSDQYPSRELDKVVIRLPDGLKERIRRVAEENGRSVNSELVTLLDRTYPAVSAIDEYIEAIASIIEKQPATDRDVVWDSLIERIGELRSKSASD